MPQDTCPTCQSPVRIEGKVTKYHVSENQQLRDTIERYRTMYDNAFANWKSCALLLKRRDEELDLIKSEQKKK